MKKLFRKTIKNRVKTTTSKVGTPFASITNERELKQSTPDLYKTVGTIYRLDIAARGFFSKKRSLMVNKLLFCSVSRYFIFKFYNLSFRLSKFFLGGCMAFFNYVNLLVNESDSLSKNFVTLDARDGGNSTSNAVNKKTDVHKEILNKNDDEIMDEQTRKINKKSH